MGGESWLAIKDSLTLCPLAYLRQLLSLCTQSVSGCHGNSGYWPVGGGHSADTPRRVVSASVAKTTPWICQSDCSMWSCDTVWCNSVCDGHRMPRDNNAEQVMMYMYISIHNHVKLKLAW